MSVSDIQQPKRGYLAQLLTVPPLIYPFQYNPTEVTDSKQLNWTTRDPLLGGPPLPISAELVTFQGAKEAFGRTFSRAGLRKLESEGERTVSFKFSVDGRETRPGEPKRRRNPAGDILADLAVVRSFVYPELLDPVDAVQAVRARSKADFAAAWFGEPPPAVLVLGDLSVEGFVTSLRITETLFNTDLNPVRAEVEITMIEKIDSLSFIVDTLKRYGRAAYYSSYASIYEDFSNLVL
jgi:hypothetical protein